VSESVVAEVARRPWPSDATFETLSVIEPDYVWDVPSLPERLEEAATAAARRASDRLCAAGLKASSSFMMGDPKEMIVDRARETGADLIVVGSRGASALTRLLLGSVASAVARFAPCSVEIVRASNAEQEPSAAMKILLATELHIPLLQMPYFSHTAMENARAEAMRKAEEAEMAAEEILADVGLDESGTVAVPAATATEIILQNAEEWDADLIVCGSHGRRGVRRFLLGSVSEGIASHAHCSVEIIRERRA